MCPGFRWTAYVFLQHIWDIRHRQQIWEVVRNLLHWLNFTHWSLNQLGVTHIIQLLTTQLEQNPTQVTSFESTDHCGEGRACQEKVWPKGALHLGQRWNKGEKEGVEGADKEASHATSCCPRHSRAPCLWLYPLLMCHHLEGTWVSCPLGAVKRTYGRTPRWMLDTLLLQATERRGFSLGILWAPILQKTVYQETTHPPIPSHQFNRSSWRPATRVSICAGPTLTIKVILVGD